MSGAAVWPGNIKTTHVALIHCFLSSTTFLHHLKRTKIISNISLIKQFPVFEREYKLPKNFIFFRLLTAVSKLLRFFWFLVLLFLQQTYILVVSSCSFTQLIDIPYFFFLPVQLLHCFIGSCCYLVLSPTSYKIWHENEFINGRHPSPYKSTM